MSCGILLKNILKYMQNLPSLARIEKKAALDRTLGFEHLPQRMGESQFLVAERDES